MRGVWLGAVLALAAGAGQAQVGTWRNYTAMHEVRDVARAEEIFWTATAGGLFAWDRRTDTFRRLTNAEGLRQMDLTAAAVDDEGSVWTGTSGGLIHVYAPGEGRWRYITDIQTSAQTSKRINRILMLGDTVLICSDFGVSVFHRPRFEFGDTFTKFGTLLATTRAGAASATIHAGRIWVAVRTGPSGNYIASASLANPNLLPPESWTLTPIGSTTNAVTAFAVFGGRLYAGTGTGLYVLQDSIWSAVMGLEGRSVRALAAGPEDLLVATAELAVYRLDVGQTVTPVGSALPHAPTTLTATASGSPVVGTLQSGLLTDDAGWIARFPNGPASNQFISVAVDPDGGVWGASGYNGNGKGFYRYRSGTWRSFTAQGDGLPMDDFFRVSVACNGDVWASSWGGGAVEIPRGTDTVTADRIYGRNVGMIGLPNDTSFIVVSSIACDGAGNTWMTVINAADGNILIARRPDGTWVRMPVKYGSGQLTSLTDNIPVDRLFAVDGGGNLWAASRDRTFRGVVAFANAGELRDSAVYTLTETNGLPSNEVRTIVTDLENDIWVGTERGIAIILDPDRPTRPGAIAAYRPLNGLTINAIAVDPLNQKWVGTPEGVIVLSQDGTQQVASYTVASTDGRLIENDVKSIAFDPATGTAYFGTAGGLSSLTTASPAPRERFGELRLYPNPLLVPSSSPLTVDGLVANSSIKILAVDGRVVRTVTTPGGRIGFWDGTDENGRSVSTGVYLVIAYSEDGNSVATGKVAVVRREP